ncbi:MAG TPA: glycosyltransferase [Candidatus Binataceae bacterium]|nr:glycosyltransferase [Candidatus Binataceae bacterium]
MNTLLLSLATLGVACSLLYYAASLITAMRFAAHASDPAPPLPKPPPRIAVLKPLSGLSPSLLANLASYLESGYPRADFFFAVPSYEDRAAEAPVALRSQYPYASITLIVGDEAGVANRKIAKVIRMAERAERAEAFVLSDADISVERGHLDRLIGELFADSRVGLVTCAYRSRPEGSFASRLAALFINTDFAPMVMLAVAIEPLRYAFGATIAVRREALEAAGGMRPLGDKLADDFELGRAVVEGGWEVRLSRSLVTSASEERTFGEFWRRKLRWARTYRTMRPLSLLTILINGPLWALVMLAVTHARPAAIAICAAVIGVRMATAALIVARTLKLPELMRDVWLVPLKDLVMAAIWAASLVGNEVVWGGRRFTISRDGVMREIADG